MRGDIVFICCEVEIIDGVVVIMLAEAGCSRGGRFSRGKNGSQSRVDGRESEEVGY